MIGSRIRVFAPFPTFRIKKRTFPEPSSSTGAGSRFSGRKHSSLLLILACAAAIVLLFSPRPGLNISEALALAKTSRTLSAEMTNEEFIAAWEDAARGRGGPKWDVEPFPGSGYLVSCLYKDRTGDLKGWFFEVFARERIARRITRSVGDVYSRKIDDIFFSYSQDVTEDEMATSWVQEAKIPSGKQDDLIHLVRETGGSHLFSASPLPEEKQLPLVDFLGAIIKRYGESAEEAQKRFGPPRTLRRKNMTSIHDGSYKYVITTLTWPGLALDFFQAPDKEVLVSATVFDHAYPFGPEPGIRIGMPFSAVVDILGEPESQESRSAVYSDGSGFYDLVFDLARSGGIDRMKFLVYMD